MKTKKVSDLTGQTKTSKAVELFKNGNLKQALAIFKTFKIGFSPDEKRNISIAYESLCGRTSFYQSLGINVALCIGSAIQTIKCKYNVTMSQYD